MEQDTWWSRQERSRTTSPMEDVQGCRICREPRTALAFSKCLFMRRVDCAYVARPHKAKQRQRLQESSNHPARPCAIGLRGNFFSVLQRKNNRIAVMVM